MSDDERARWTQYGSPPQWERMRDRFTGFRLSGVEFEMETLDFSVLDIHPGESGAMHFHEEPVEEVYVVLEGRVDVDLIDDTVEATTGAGLCFPPGQRGRRVTSSHRIDPRGPPSRRIAPRCRETF